VSKVVRLNLLGFILGLNKLTMTIMLAPPWYFDFTHSNIFYRALWPGSTAGGSMFFTGEHSDYTGWSIILDNEKTLSSKKLVVMLLLRGIDKKLAGQAILNDIHLPIDAGLRVAIAGPSGVGKTTMLRLIVGLERPDSGVIMLGE